MTPGPNTITITATVNNTTGSGDSIPNTASVAWDNGKGDSGTFDTGTVTVNLVEGSITIDKFDGSKLPTDKLAGATFTLTDAAGVPLRDIEGAEFSATTDASGAATFDRLPYGTYYLQETAAPGGFRLPARLIQVTVDATSPNPTVTVANYPSSWVLPETGTWGVLPYYGLGALMVGVFVALQIRQRRQAA